MKTINLITTSLQSAPGKYVTYKDLIKMCLENKPQGGFGLMDIRNRITILDALDKSVACVTLEDAQAQVLARCIETMQWAMCSKDILSFCDSVLAECKS